MKLVNCTMFNGVHSLQQIGNISATPKYMSILTEVQRLTVCMYGQEYQINPTQFSHVLQQNAPHQSEKYHVGFIFLISFPLHCVYG